MLYNDILTINGYHPPAPTEGGIKIGVEPIWSSNTGRSASGLMLGDIIAVKTTLDITWKKMTQAQVSQLDNAIHNINTPFFDVSYYNQDGDNITKTFYASPNSYNQKKYTENGIMFSDISIKLIEQ